MRGPRSLQIRLALALGLAVTVMWLAAAAITERQLRRELDQVFDSTLRDAAHRILPLAMRDGRDGREGRDGPDRGDHERVARQPETEDFYTYLIFDRSGRVILGSEDADPGHFPPFEREGFVQTGTHRLFYDRGRRDDLVIAVAEPLAHRRSVARSMAMRLSLPMLAIVPLMLGAIFLVVRGSLAPVRQMRDDLAARGAGNLSAVADRGLPSELSPVVRAINALLARLNAAFEAERGFAANAAHELRTPVAGAIAQAQRLRAETADTQAAARAGEIETTLKRLNGLSEKLMQLARAEGARLRLDSLTDMRPILRMIVEDFTRFGPGNRVDLTLADTPVLSDLDPDAFGILSRNLVENALKHGTPGRPVSVDLSDRGVLTVTNSGPVVPPGDLARLTARFARSTGNGEGSGLGLAIVQTIAERAAADIAIASPAPGQPDGFEVRITLPAVG